MRALLPSIVLLLVTSLLPIDAQANMTSLPSIEAPASCSLDGATGSVCTLVAHKKCRNKQGYRICTPKCPCRL